MRVPPALAPLTDRPAHAAVLLDFDGSLSAIVDDPAAVQLLPEARTALELLVARIELVAVVSGRPVDVLARVVDVDGIDFVGQYGLESRVDGDTVIDERVRAFTGAIAAAAADAERVLPGLTIERKGEVAVTVHWRTAPERGDEAEAMVDEIGRRHGLAVYPTRMARELRPPLPVDKGTGVEALLVDPPGRRIEVACYAGDDHADLAAFAALDRLVATNTLRSAARIAVRSDECPPELVARADLVVDGPAGLADALTQLAGAVSAPR